MGPPEGFALSKCILATESSSLHLAHEEAGEREVLLKCYHGSQGVERAQREFERFKALAGPGVAQVRDLDLEGDEPWLVLAPFDGQVLRHVGTLEIGAWIDLATQLTACLRHLHAKHWILRSLHPGCLLATTDPPDVRLIEVKHAIEYGSAGSNDAVGDPAYMAPEQFGRMGRGMDFRSDLYSLGATLYAALTGQAPFAGKQALELMHAHMAQRPAAPSELRADVPRVLSDLLLKLLHKEPDDRYQTASTLHTDLLELQEQWARDGSLQDDFMLACGDAQNRPLFSHRLYGRDTEIQELAEALERARSGSCELWLLRGPPGIGKSVLIEELRRRSIRDGFLVQGKFDLYARDQPYSGWAAALESLAQQILVRGNAEIQAWRRRVETRLGPNVSVLADWLPDWRFILGDVPAPPALEPRETQARLTRTTVGLLEAAARPKQPLILFLDDLQWTDSGSRFLLGQVVRAGGAPGLLLVCTYRDGEVDAGHPLRTTLAEIESGPVRTGVLQIAPLSRDAALEMLSDVFDKPRDAVAELADRVLTKTENNPFLIQQFIDHMRSLGNVSFSASAGWTWDLEGIASADISDDAVELIAARIEHVEPHAREVLVFASFIGDEFDAEELRELANRDLAAIEFALCALSEAGLLAPCRTGFRFVHDRIREAAQSLKSEAERSLLHYDTASLLLHRTPDDELEDRATEIADHLRRATDRIPADRVHQVVQLDVWAAARALAAGAGDAARGYLDHASTLTSLHGTSLAPALAFDLDYLRTQTRIQAFEYDEASEIARQLAEREQDPIRFSRVTALRIDIASYGIREQQEGWGDRQVQAALEVTREALGRLGCPYPLRPGPVRALLEVLWTYWKIRGLTADDFLREWTEPNEQQQAILRVDGSSFALVFAQPYRCTVSGAWRIRHFREGWGGGFLPGCLVHMAMMLILVFGWRDAAERIAGIVLELIDRGYPTWIAGGTALGSHGMVYGYTRHPSSCVEGIEHWTRVSMEAGELAWASAMIPVSIQMRFRAGEPLPELLQAIRRGEDLAASAFDPGMCRTLASSRRMLECLCQAEPPKLDRSPLGTDVTKLNGLIAGFVWLVFEEPARALEALELSEQSAGMPDHGSFHRGLACLDLLGSSEPCDRRRVKRALRRSCRQVKTLARRFPEHRLHHKLLLDAERAHLKGRRELAIATARKAVETARTRGYPVDAALALERLARMLFDTNRASEGTEKILQAIELYEDYGANAKVTLLRSRYTDAIASLDHRRRSAD